MLLKLNPTRSKMICRLQTSENENICINCGLSLAVADFAFLPMCVLCAILCAKDNINAKKNFKSMQKVAEIMKG